MGRHQTQRQSRRQHQRLHPQRAAQKSTGSTTDIVDRNRVFGTLVVTAKFASNGELCGVAVNFDVWDRKSVQIEQYALPKLNARAKKAKSANIQESQVPRLYHAHMPLHCKRRLTLSRCDASAPSFVFFSDGNHGKCACQ